MCVCVGVGGQKYGKHTNTYTCDVIYESDLANHIILPCLHILSIVSWRSLVGRLVPLQGVPQRLHNGSPNES